MLSRFSSLFTYVVVGLVVSAAATPMGGPLGGLTGGGGPAKSLTHPGSPPAMKPYDNKPYDDDKRKPYDGDDKAKSYDDKPYDDHNAGQCSVQNQHCCNQVNQAHESAKVDSLNLLGLGFLVGAIKDSNKLWGSDCSPFFGGFEASCDNQPICCENNHMNGLIVVGCSNVNVI